MVCPACRKKCHLNFWSKTHQPHKNTTRQPWATSTTASTAAASRHFPCHHRSASVFVVDDDIIVMSRICREGWTTTINAGRASSADTIPHIAHLLSNAASIIVFSPPPCSLPSIHNFLTTSMSTAEPLCRKICVHTL